MIRTVVTAIESMLPQSVKDRLIQRYSVPDVEWSLRNARQNGFSPQTIIDVGAYIGEWSEMAHQIYPNARILAVEAQQDKMPRLEKLSNSHECIQYRMALLGAEESDEVTFHLKEMASSVLSEEEDESPAKEVRSLTTLDKLVGETRFAEPDLLKLDVQGYELEVLQGGERIFSSHPPELILMEVSLIEINEGAPLFAEVTEYMDERDYRLYDICSFMRRPFDDALWQIDALFAHNNSNLVESKRWK